MRRALFLTLIASAIFLSSSEAAVRVLKVEGVAKSAKGSVMAAKTLRAGDIIGVGDTISVGTNSFLDLQFQEAHQLLRLLSNTAVTFDSDEYGKGGRSLINLNISWGKVCGVSAFTNASWLVIRSEDSSCSIAGPGRTDFVFDGAKAGSLSGSISTAFAMSTDRCRAHYSVSAKKEGWAKPGRLEMNEQESAFLKEQLVSLEASAIGENRAARVVRRTTQKGKRITPLR
jgi:hypothetical protein